MSICIQDIPTLLHISKLIMKDIYIEEVSFASPRIVQSYCMLRSHLHGCILTVIGLACWVITIAPSKPRPLLVEHCPYSIPFSGAETATTLFAVANTGGEVSILSLFQFPTRLAPKKEIRGSHLASRRRACTAYRVPDISAIAQFSHRLYLYLEAAKPEPRIVFALAIGIRASSTVKSEPRVWEHWLITSLDSGHCVPRVQFQHF